MVAPARPLQPWEAGAAGSPRAQPRPSPHREPLFPSGLQASKGGSGQEQTWGQGAVPAPPRLPLPFRPPSGGPHGLCHPRGSRLITRGHVAEREPAEGLSGK